MKAIKISKHARDLRDNVGLSEEEPIEDLLELVDRAGYEYMEKDFGDDFSGFSRPISSFNYLIGFNSNHYWNDGFRRFTIAHELGHVFMPPHQEIIRSEGGHESRPEFQSNDKIEREADRFAINFLAPKAGASRYVRRGSFTTDQVTDLADRFGISFYAAALRFVELTDLSCMLIVCDEDGTIRYEKRADALDGNWYHPSLNGQPISARTVTYDFMEGRRDEDEAEIWLNDWYPNLENQVEAREEVVDLGYNGTYLTLLAPHKEEFWAD